MGTHPIFESDFDCLTVKFRCKMGSSQVELTQVPSKNSDLSTANGILSVIGEASRVVPPDITELICIISSQKSTVKDVRESVEKWKEYMITQARKAGSDSQKDIHVYENLERTADNEYSLELQINFKLSNFKAAQKLRSLFVEKLPAHVGRIFPLEMTHSSTCIEKIGEGVRAEAIHKAKENARSTASQMRVKLGKITNIQDLHVEVKKITRTK